MGTENDIFAAVFPPSADVVIPTPTATPVLGSSAFGESFGGPVVPEFGAESSAAEQIAWDRAWHTATAYLSVPNEHITAAPTSQDEGALKSQWIKPFTNEVANAVSYLLADDSRGRQLRKNSTKDNLLHWYYEEVGSRHYVDYVLPGLFKCLTDEENANALYEVFQTLQIAQTIYLYPLKNNIAQFLPDTGRRELAQARANLHGLFAHSVPQNVFNLHLSQFLKQQAFAVFEIDLVDESHVGSTASEARQKTFKVIRSLNHVGLGDGRAQRLFAEAMNEALIKHVETRYAGKWSSPSTVPQELRGWIEDQFARFAVEVLACLEEVAGEQPATLTKITHADVQRWQEMGIGQLGALRVSELFNVIVDWDNGSRGALEDLKSYVNNPSARLHVTQDFSEVVSHRLLQPGASTTQILQMYISIIRSFTFLDPKGVLLDRVARPIRRYLRERDDTVNIVVGGLLADAEDESPSPEVLTELAVELDKTGGLPVEEGKGSDDADLDWDDMTWVPDPVDAPPEYKRSKHNDVIGALISLFDSKDTFINEYQKILGEHLLRREHDLEKEIRVLELLKIRFGESSLQACEVMLRDIGDSRRLDLAIGNDQSMLVIQPSSGDTHLSSKILSHLFWPSLNTETFALPSPITNIQTRYATTFSTLKPSRKLTWLPSLGQVTVHLDLEDRVVLEEVQTWQASVIYAFDSDASGRHCAPVVKTIQELMSHLEMSEFLVRNALTFWVSKFVLAQSAPDTYRVLETLPSDALASTSTSSTAQAAAAAAASDAVASAAASHAVRSEEDMQSEKMEVFWQFVVGMLTNQGPMKLERIVMMLKMVVPGGFPFGNEEMREYLGGKVEEGRLEVGSGEYRIVH